MIDVCLIKNCLGESEERKRSVSSAGSSRKMALPKAESSVDAPFTYSIPQTPILIWYTDIPIDVSRE